MDHAMVFHNQRLSPMDRFDNMRLSIGPCPMKHNLPASLPLRWSPGHWDRWSKHGSFARFWSWKSASALRPPPCVGGSPEPSWSLTLFIEPQASINQRVIDREVIARQKPLHLGLPQPRRWELGRDVAFQQPVAILRESRMVPGCVVNADFDEPAEQ